MDRAYFRFCEFSVYVYETRRLDGRFVVSRRLSMAKSVDGLMVSQVDTWFFSEEDLARIDEWCRTNGFTRANATVSLVKAELHI